MLYRLVKSILAPLMQIWLRIDVIGLENIPNTGSVVLASNHVSLLDPPLIGSLVDRKVHFMAKDELFKNSITNYVFTKLGAFPVKRGCADRNAIKKALDILAENKILAIFPEGTRSKNGSLSPLEAGAMMIAVKSKSTVVPVAIKGPEKLSFTNLFPKVKIIFGKPLMINTEDNCKERMTELTKCLSESISEQLKKM